MIKRLFDSILQAKNSFGDDPKVSSYFREKENMVSGMKNCINLFHSYPDWFYESALIKEQSLDNFQRNITNNLSQIQDKTYPPSWISNFYLYSSDKERAYNLIISILDKFGSTEDNLDANKPNILGDELKVDISQLEFFFHAIPTKFEGIFLAVALSAYPQLINQTNAYSIGMTVKYNLSEDIPGLIKIINSKALSQKY